MAFVRLATFVSAALVLIACRTSDRAHTTSPAHASIPAPAPQIEPAPAPQLPPRAPELHAETWIIHPRYAPFSDHPDVLVHAPERFDAHGPVNVVVFLHGWYGCVSVVAGNTRAPCTPGGPARFPMDVVAQFDRAAVDALLVIPQLAFDAASCAPGRLGETGGLRAMLRDALAAPELAERIAGRTDVDRLGDVVLVAHSGAYVAAALALARGRVDVREVYMLDALYRDRVELDAWVSLHARDFDPRAQTPRRLAFVYTDREGTGPLTRTVLARLGALLPDAWRSRAVQRHDTLDIPDVALYAVPLFALRTPAVHEDVPRVFLAPLLDASPALARAGADTSDAGRVAARPSGTVYDPHP